MKKKGNVIVIGMTVGRGGVSPGDAPALPAPDGAPLSVAEGIST